MSNCSLVSEELERVAQQQLGSLLKNWETVAIRDPLCQNKSFFLFVAVVWYKKNCAGVKMEKDRIYQAGKSG